MITCKLCEPKYVYEKKKIYWLKKKFLFTLNYKICLVHILHKGL